MNAVGMRIGKLFLNCGCPVNHRLVSPRFVSVYPFLFCPRFCCQPLWVDTALCWSKICLGLNLKEPLIRLNLKWIRCVFKLCFKNLPLDGIELSDFSSGQASNLITAIVPSYMHVLLNVFEFPLTLKHNSIFLRLIEKKI